MRIGDCDRILRLVRHKVERGLRYVANVRLGSIWPDDCEAKLFEQINRAVGRSQGSIHFSIITDIEQGASPIVRRFRILSDQLKLPILRKKQKISEKIEVRTASLKRRPSSKESFLATKDGFRPS